MEPIFIPTENDFRRWISDAIKEHFEKMPSLPTGISKDEEPLLTRKEIAGVFRISLVTLHDWIKRGLPCHKQRGRVYFLRSEVVAYIRQKGGNKAIQYINLEKNCPFPFGYKIVTNKTGTVEK